MKIAFVAAACVALFAPAVASAAQIFDCTLNGTDTETGSWISPRVIIIREPGAMTATVNDAVIVEFVGHPIEAKLEQEGKRRSIFSWAVDIADSSNNKATFHYSASIERATGKIQMSADAFGYRNRNRASGTCRIGTVKPGTAKKK